jgi:hypothetical protein
MEKPKNAKFLFSKKVKWGSVFTFQVPYRYGIHGTWPKKIPKVCDQNSDFHI